MADNIDPQQIEQLNEALEKLVDVLGEATGVTTKKTKEEQAEIASKKLVKQGLEKLGTSAADLTKNLYAGGKGAGTFGDAVEDAAGAVGLLLLALGPFSLAAKVAALAIGAFAKGLNVAAKQGDALYKTYQDLQKSGATASDGITGVFKSMQGFGYGIEELDKMVQLVSQNSESLAKFSTTAADGTRAFSDAMTNIVRDPELKLLGKTPEELNKAGAAFIRQQVAMGRSQKQIGDQLGSSTKQYVMDLDRLQRLTGTSAEALQKQQDALLDVDAYNVYMESLEEQGDAGKAQAQKIKDITLMFPQLQKEIAGALAGNVEAAGKLNLIAPNLLNDLRDPVKSTSDTVKTLGGELKGFKGTMGKNFGLDPTMRELAGSYKDLNESILTADNYDERAAAAKKNAIVTDDATKNLTKINLDQMNARDSLQSFVQLGVAPATRALAKLSGGASALTSELPGTGAGNRPGAMSGTAGEGGKAAGGSDNAAAALKFFQAAGWSKEQAAGIVGNLQAESGKNLNTKAVGDSGAAKGIAQWHPDRQAKFKDVMGKGLDESSLEDQLKFVDWELKNTEKRAGDQLRQAKTAAQAAFTVDKMYERSSGAHLANRIASANTLFGDSSMSAEPLSGFKPTTAGANPTKTLTQTEILAKQNREDNGSTGENTDLLSKMLEKLDALYRTNNDQLNVQQKQLVAARN